MPFVSALCPFAIRAFGDGVLTAGDDERHLPRGEAGGVCRLHGEAEGAFLRGRAGENTGVGRERHAVGQRAAVGPGDRRAAGGGDLLAVFLAHRGRGERRGGDGGRGGQRAAAGVLALHNAGHADGLVGVDVADGVNAVVARERRAVGLYGKAVAAGVAVAGGVTVKEKLPPAFTGSWSRRSRQWYSRCRPGASRYRSWERSSALRSGPASGWASAARCRRER